MTTLLSQGLAVAVTIDDISLLKYSMPQPFLRQQVYDPTWGDPSYAKFTGKRVIPAVGSLIKNPDDTAVWVVGLNDDFTPIYDDFKTTGATDEDVSFYTVDTERLALYVDTRATPTRVKPDGKMLVTGLSPRSYRLIRNPNSDTPEVISNYKDTTGKYVSGSIPLVKVSDTLSIWSLPECFVYPTLAINEEISIELIDETGLVVRKGLLFVAQTEFINDAMVYQPMIVDLQITANQTLANGDFYLYQNQSIKNLHLTAKVVYEDGSTDILTVGKDNCFLYGVVDFVSSFPGLRQEFLIRYFLGASQNADPALIDGATQSVFKEITVVVVPNDMKTPVKIQAFPIWNTAANQYIVRWMMYFADGRAPVDVTGPLTYPQTQLNTTPQYFGLSQNIRVQVDMSVVDPTSYSIATLYQQDFTFVMRPPTSAVRWLIQDGQDATRVYGVDTNDTRRPRICWDVTRKQYFIPTSYFPVQDSFLEAFYYNATPMYDQRIATGAVVPTHFRIRDVLSFATKVATPIAVGDYNKAFALLGDSAGNYVSGSLLVEFLTLQSDGSYATIFGGCVDVTTGTYQG